MCVVSMVGDYYADKWQYPQSPVIPGTETITNIWTNGPSQADFDALKKEVEDMKQLLIRAKIYDEENGEPDCEQDEKVELLKKVAEAVGVDLSEIFGK